MERDRVERERLDLTQVDEGRADDGSDASRTVGRDDQVPVTTPVDVAPVDRVAPAPIRPLASEEVARIQVEPEDRLAFRVGVNFLTLALVALTVYLVWRRYFAGG